VKNFFEASLAFLCLIAGLIGMARYSSPQAPSSSIRHSSSDEYAPVSSRSGHGSARRVSAVAGADNIDPDDTNTIGSAGTKASHKSSGSGKTYKTTMSPLEIEPFVKEAATNALVDDEVAIMGGVDDDSMSDVERKDRAHKDNTVLFGGRLSLTRRQLGVVGAVINGTWGGLSLVPLHYALRDDGLTGAGFVISFAGGAAIVNIALWILLVLFYLYHKEGKWHEAVECLPRWHFDQLLVPGMMAGLLYSLGNFGSIIAVTYLGQATGYSVSQMQLFVSGLWGVFWFQEIKGAETILKWFLSASIAVLGIIWLSYEHEGQALGHRRR